MKTHSMFSRLIFGSKAVIICMVFTLATILDAVLSTVWGVYEIDYIHIFMRLALCTLIVLSLYIFRLFDNLPLFIMLIIHALIAAGIMLLGVWVSSFFMDIHPNAYRDAARTILFIYPAVIALCAAADIIRTARANRVLKKLDE